MFTATPLEQKLLYEKDFPIQISLMTIQEYPLHFHRDLEILYVLRGTIQLRVNGAQAEVRELVFWNPADGARFAAAKVEPARIAQGERTLSFEMSAAPARSMNELDVVKGRLVVCNPADGKTAEINFTLPYKLTTK